MPARVKLTAEEARRLGIQAPASSPYKAQRTMVDGHSFASKKEANRYCQLRQLQSVGLVDWFAVQPVFLLEGGKWRADFIVKWADGRVTVEDPKGWRATTHKRMLKMVKARYPKLEVIET